MIRLAIATVIHFVCCLGYCQYCIDCCYYYASDSSDNSEASAYLFGSWTGGQQDF